MITKLICSLILILLMAACSPVAAKIITITSEPTPAQITAPPISTNQPGSIATPGPTDIFITQVMATKYAARTQDAALPTETPTPTIPPTSPACRHGDLTVSFNTNGATGRIVLEIGVTNISDSPCFLPAWPQVELLDQSGKALDIVYYYDYLNANPSNMPPTQADNQGQLLAYGLQAGQSAGLALIWGDWCHGAVQGGVTIRMALLGSNSWLDIRTNIEGGGYCDDTSSPSTIEVIGFGY